MGKQHGKGNGGQVLPYPIPAITTQCSGRPTAAACWRCVAVSPVGHRSPEAWGGSTKYLQGVVHGATAT